MGGFIQAAKLVLVKAQRGGQQPNRLSTRHMPVSSFQIANAAHAHAGAFGQFLLGESGLPAVAAQQLGEGRRRAVCHLVHLVPSHGALLATALQMSILSAW